MTETTLPIRFKDTPSGTRRIVRETALRVLYALDAGKRGDETDAVLADNADAAELSGAARLQMTALVAGVSDNRRAIDAELDTFATDFPTHRQAVVDRNILRLAVAEIVFAVSDAPAGAVVNEAVELAKKYSTKDSGRFVNGVLGALVRARDASFMPEPEPDRDEVLPALPTRYWGDPSVAGNLHDVPPADTPLENENA